MRFMQRKSVCYDKKSFVKNICLSYNYCVEVLCYSIIFRKYCICVYIVVYTNTIIN